MFSDPSRARVHDEIHRCDHALFTHILTADLFIQAARMCGLRLLANPLNLVNLVWLAISAARNPEKTFAQLLCLPFDTLRNSENFSASLLNKLIDEAKVAPTGNRQQRRAQAAQAKHDPHGSHPERVTEKSFDKARLRMPSEFWVAVFLLLAEKFVGLYGAVIRWRHFRLMAVDGSRLNLPDYPELRQYFGTASNSGGSHNAQAQLVMVQFPLARLPYAYALAPVKLGEVTLARQLLHGLSIFDLVLLDAGFLSYGLLWQIQQQSGHFVVRLRKNLNLRKLQDLGPGDQLVQWTPKDSRGNWRKEGLPRSIVLRVLTYKVRGFRPLKLLSNVLSAKEVSHQEFWGLTVSQEGEVLTKGLYNNRWEIETSYRELKVEQKLEGSLRSRTPEGIYYEVAGHILYYTLVRWLLVEAAVKAGVSPLRLSFKAALEAINDMWPMALVAGEAWRDAVLRPRLLEKMASHVVVERPCRQYPRSKKQRKASKRRADKKAKQANKARSGRKQQPAQQRS